jgi:hypothetical protein
VVSRQWGIQLMGEGPRPRGGQLPRRQAARQRPQPRLPGHVAGALVAPRGKDPPAEKVRLPAPLGMTGKHPPPRQSRGHPGEAQSRKKFSKIRPALKFGYGRSEPLMAATRLVLAAQELQAVEDEQPTFILDGAVPQGLIIAPA